MGVNDFIKDNEEIDIPILELSTETTKNQIQKLERLKNSRDGLALQKALNELTIACRNNLNLVEPIIKAAKQYATIGEIVHTMKNEFGEWQESAIF